LPGLVLEGIRFFNKLTYNAATIVANVGFAYRF
jgi:hypothetical protein